MSWHEELDGLDTIVRTGLGHLYEAECRHYVSMAGYNIGLLLGFLSYNDYTFGVGVDRNKLAFGIFMSDEDREKYDSCDSCMKFINKGAGCWPCLYQDCYRASYAAVGRIDTESNDDDDWGRYFEIEYQKNGWYARPDSP